MDKDTRTKLYTHKYYPSKQNEVLLSGRIIGLDSFHEVYSKRKARKNWTLCGSFTVSINIYVTILSFYYQIREMSDCANFVKNPTFLFRVIIVCFIEW